MPTLSNEKSYRSSLVLSNAVTIVSKVIQKISGNDISSNINGNKATTEIIEVIAANRIIEKLTSK